MKVKLPFEPSTLGQVAACAAIDDIDHLKKSVEINNLEKNKLISFFKNKNYKYIDSATNFITIEMNSEFDVKEFCQKMLSKGIILRDLSSFGLSKCIRISIGKPDENEILINAINNLEI